MNTRVLIISGFGLLLLSLIFNVVNMRQLSTVRENVEELEIKISSVEDAVDELKGNEVDDFGSRIDDLESDLGTLKSDVEYIKIQTNSY
jgi:predicted  nucleic acid-binding Zn-ribbon protein